MDVLSKIDKLRIERNWTYYKLSEESGITQSTIANMFARKSTPSISTLECFCKAFNISLAEFFCDEDISGNQEIVLLSYFKKLSSKDAQTVIALTKYLSGEN